MNVFDPPETVSHEPYSSAWLCCGCDGPMPSHTGYCAPCDAVMLCYELTAKREEDDWILAVTALIVARRAAIGSARA